MILAALIFWLMAGALLAWLSGVWSKAAPRWIALLFLLAETGTLIWIWAANYGQFQLGSQGAWAISLNVPWIPRFGISINLAMDGLSFLLAMLTNLLGIMAVAASWRGIQEKVGFFHFNVMLSLATLTGVFLSLDLFLFYFFWELMLVPLYFLIGIWGHENRVYATLKFFLFTQISGLLMLLSILGLVVVHGQNTGVYTFSYIELLGTSMPPITAFWLMLGFFAAFAVKLPAVPVHTWLADAHTEAPTAGSVLLAGLVLKAAAYGFIRFLVPLFPQAAFNFAPVAMALGVAGIVYAALLSFAQSDLKRLVAYTSVSHMGFVLLGIFAWNQLSLQGAVVIMLSHGVSTGALFILVGDLQDRMKTRDMNKMGGLFPVITKMGGTGMLFALASLGLPGLGNFVGEFLVLLGVYRVNIVLAILATLGFIVSTVYALWMIQRTFFGPNVHNWELKDYGGREMAIQATLIAIILWLGLYPQTVLNTARGALSKMQEYAGTPTTVSQVDGRAGLDIGLADVADMTEGGGQ